MNILTSLTSKLALNGAGKANFSTMPAMKKPKLKIPTKRYQNCVTYEGDDLPTNACHLSSAQSLLIQLNKEEMAKSMLEIPNFRPGDALELKVGRNRSSELLGESD